MYLAIDIGGTKTLVAVLSAGGEVLQSVRFETPELYPDFLKEFETSFSKLEKPDHIKACVVGAPGKINRTRGTGIAFGNLEWENVPIGHDLKSIVKVPVLVENDANLAGLSEAILVRKQYKKALYITISTGIGGVLIINGKIDPDTADMEFGHMLFEHNDQLQKWQDFASGKAIFKKFGKRASEITDASAWYVISRNIAIGLINVISTLTPDVVIIGGGVGSHFEKFSDRLREELIIYGSDVVTIPPLLKAQRAEEAVIYGCYELARQNDTD